MWLFNSMVQMNDLHYFRRDTLLSARVIMSVINEWLLRRQEELRDEETLRL